MPRFPTHGAGGGSVEPTAGRPLTGAGHRRGGAFSCANPGERAGPWQNVRRWRARTGHVGLKTLASTCPGGLCSSTRSTPDSRRRGRARRRPLRGSARVQVLCVTHAPADRRRGRRAPPRLEAPSARRCANGRRERSWTGRTIREIGDCDRSCEWWQRRPRPELLDAHSSGGPSRRRCCPGLGRNGCGESTPQSDLRSRAGSEFLQGVRVGGEGSVSQLGLDETCHDTESIWPSPAGGYEPPRALTKAGARRHNTSAWRAGGGEAVLTPRSAIGAPQRTTARDAR